MQEELRILWGFIGFLVFVIYYLCKHIKDLKAGRYEEEDPTKPANTRNPFL